MPATIEILKRWYDEGEAQGATHMIVFCDSFEYRGSPSDDCCYPVFVKPGEDAFDRAQSSNDRLMEVYSYSHTKDEQFSTRKRVFNYD